MHASVLDVERRRQPGAHLRAGWRFNENWEVGIWANNLADEEYLTDAGNTGLLFGIPTVIAGPDRSYGVTLRAKF